MKKIQILHITPHLGGGVGRVLLNYLTYIKKDVTYEHKALCLDSANKKAKNIAKSIQLTLEDHMFKKKLQLLDKIKDSDIVLIHWWNHPLLFHFLVTEVLPPCRIVLWSHISGFHPPNVFTKKVINYPDLFVFTTPLSFQAREIQELSENEKKHLRSIWSTGGIEHLQNLKHKDHKKFNVGYIGTVDYCKLHPDFLKICDSIDIPEINFLVCGGNKHNELEKEVNAMNLANKIKILGPVDDIKDFLPIFDVFGYPLAQYHYGTCDQTIQESMAAGIVPVVFSNPMESYMVKDGETGFVAKNVEEYIKRINELYRNPDLREKLSLNAIEYAKNTFSIEKMANDWKRVFEETLKLPKKERKWSLSIHQSKIQPVDVFLESLGIYGKDFLNYYNAKEIKEKMIFKEAIKKKKNGNWNSDTKGTVHHYHFFFPSDKYLAKWSQLMKKRV